MNCGNCGTTMEEGIIVHLGGKKPALLTGLYWCKKRGLLSNKDQINLMSQAGRKEAFICKHCSVVSFNYD